MDYERPNMEIIQFIMNDVVCMSNPTGEDDGETDEF